jgi:pSer/pThr/pTyr-binding forkhead associated (FHA) protein
MAERNEAERTGVPFLDWRDRDGAQQILMLEPGRERVTVGRSCNSDVTLPWDPEVSRLHALLELVGREGTVIDDGLSRTGSFINGDRVLGRQRLHNGDRLVFGRTHVEFRDSERGVAEPGDSDDPTGEGVREPRRPTPTRGSGSIQLPPPDDAN